MALPVFDRDFYLELWRRVLASDYVLGIEEGGNGQGLDVPAVLAAMWERYEEAINVTQQAYYLKAHSTQTGEPASGAQFAAGSVEMRRAGNAEGVVTIPAGTVVEAHLLGSRGQDILQATFAVLVDVTLPAGDPGPVTLAIEATRAGRESNVAAGKIDRFAELGRAEISCTPIAVNELRDTGAPDVFSEAMVGRYVRLVGLPSGVTFPRRITSVIAGATNRATVDPPLDPGDVGAAITAEVEEWADLGLTVVNPQPTTGGRHAMLDQIGADRAAGRAAGESDASYRDRLAVLEDIISPAAIERIATRVLAPLGVAFQLLETRREITGGIWDVDPWDVGGVFEIPPGVLPGADSQVFAGGHVWLSGAELTRFFMLHVAPGNHGEFGGAWDVDPWDEHAWDGFPVVYNAAIGALHHQIAKAKLGGVRFVIARNFALGLPDDVLPFFGAWDLDAWDEAPWT